MEKIQCMTTISRYELDDAKNREAIKYHVQKRMAEDIAIEILKKIPIIETEEYRNFDKKYLLSFYVSTKPEEIEALDAFMAALGKIFKGATK